MRIERVDLYKYYRKERKEGQQGYLNLYVADECMDKQDVKRPRPAMLILGGGAYQVVSKREKEPIAFEFLRKGFSCFTLDYSVGEACVYPTALLEACMAICYIKENADDLMIKSDKVCAVGFSAGGHLTAMLHCLYKEQIVKDYLGERAKLARPDAVILSYPVITSSKKTHAGTIQNISGGDKELANFLSMEKRVHSKVCPAFIWSTFEDTAVPLENSMLYATALRKKKIPFELMIFEKGHHGLSIANEITGTTEFTAGKWVALSIEWLRERGFLIG